MNLQGSVLHPHPAGSTPGAELTPGVRPGVHSPTTLGMTVQIIQVILTREMAHWFTYSAASLASSITAKLPD